MSTPPLDYRNPLHAAASAKRSPTVGQIARWALIGFGALLLLVSLLLPSTGRSRETANRMKCASNLRQIGQAVLLYQNENRGQMPPDLGTLLATEDLISDYFCCASSNATKATGATTQAVVADLLSGGHLSYAWAGGGLTGGQPADAVLAFDVEDHQPRDNAVGVGINVLLGDGSVQFVDAATAKAVRAQYHAGTRPIRLPAPTTNPSAE